MHISPSSHPHNIFPSLNSINERAKFKLSFFMVCSIISLKIFTIVIILFPPDITLLLLISIKLLLWQQLTLSIIFIHWYEDKFHLQSLLSLLPEISKSFPFNWIIELTKAAFPFNALMKL